MTNDSSSSSSSIPQRVDDEVVTVASSDVFKNKTIEVANNNITEATALREYIIHPDTVPQNGYVMVFDGGVWIPKNLEEQSFSARNANTFLAGPVSGSPAAPTFRIISNDDLPSDIPVEKIEGISQIVQTLQESIDQVEPKTWFLS